MDLSPVMLTSTTIVPCNDRDRSRDFYVSLGFTVVYEATNYVICSRDQVQIHLSWHEGWFVDPATNNTQLRIHVRHVDLFYAHCQQLGVVHPHGPLEDKPWGNREFTARDPDNACITFYEPIAHST